ncbi:MAG: SIS domain-containing protein [Kiritimatiellae bacterium]|nr:SIS domain-containing protein [Kiritimatiellia bacterium]
MTKKQMWDRMQQVWRVEADCVARLCASIDPDAITAVVRLLAACRGKVFTTGVGTSGAAARKIAHSLSCVEIPATFLSPADGVHGGLGVVRKGDVVIAISKGGGTEEIVKILPAVRAKGAKLVGVTENGKSTLAQASDIVLNVKVDKEPDEFNMLATASTMAVIAAFDAVAIALMVHTGYSRDQFKLIHPGGAVGERLVTGKA